MDDHSTNSSLRLPSAPSCSSLPSKSHSEPVGGWSGDGGLDGQTGGSRSPRKKWWRACLELWPWECEGSSEVSWWSRSCLEHFYYE